MIPIYIDRGKRAGKQQRWPNICKGSLKIMGKTEKRESQEERERQRLLLSGKMPLGKRLSNSKQTLLKPAVLHCIQRKEVLCTSFWKESYKRNSHLHPHPSAWIHPQVRGNFRVRLTCQVGSGNIMFSACCTLSCLLPQLAMRSARACCLGQLLTS